MSDLINRQQALEAIQDAHHHVEVMSMMDNGRLSGLGQASNIIRDLPSAETQPITCDGCKHVGTYDTDFPCSSCIRREKDCYEPEE